VVTSKPVAAVATRSCHALASFAEMIAFVPGRHIGRCARSSFAAFFWLMVKVGLALMLSVTRVVDRPANMRPTVRGAIA